jgi:hypothetical protein
MIATASVKFPNGEREEPSMKPALRSLHGTAARGARFPYMQTSLVPILILLLITGGIAIGYFARPAETPEQYAHRTCKEAPTAGVTYERCVEGRMLQRLAGRKDDDR